jgi:hypothetical protein
MTDGQVPYSDRLLAAVDQADEQLGMRIVGASSAGLLMRYAILTDHAGNVATRVAAFPPDFAAGVRRQFPASALAELATGLRQAAAALDPAGAAEGERVYTAGELARIIGDLERTRAHASCSRAFLALRERLGRLGLPSDPVET